MLKQKGKEGREEITILIWLGVDQALTDGRVVSGQQAPQKYSDQTVSNI